MTLGFDKYHGLGNDFLVVELDSAAELPIARAVQLCDRHFGVGGDGVLLVLRSTTSKARARMVVINADGSTPEMCGNGLRCVALHLCRRAGQNGATFLVETGAGLLRCEVERDGALAHVGTAIGRGSHLGSIEVETAHGSLSFERISTGNPHAICFSDPMDPAELDRLGPALSSQIPGGSNVEIATLKGPTELALSVWERGVGRTLACGTGAAATAIEAVRSGRCPADTPLTVHLPGGPLTLTVSPDLRAHLRGPAEWVYTGQTRL